MPTTRRDDASNKTSSAVSGMIFKFSSFSNFEIMSALGNSSGQLGRKTAIWTFVKIMVAVFLCEAAVMAILHALGPRDIWGVLLDPILLTVMATPVLYQFIVRPIQGALEERERAEKSVQTTNQNLKSEIKEREKAERALQTANRFLSEATKKLEDSNRELQGFAYIASHDLREPLRKISSFGGLLKESLAAKLDHDQQENLDFMINGADRMNQMIEGLLVYSRLTTREIAPEVVDLNETLEQLVQLELAAALEEADATIEVPQPLSKVWAVPVQMNQLLQNLIINGIKYRREDIQSKIVITAKRIAQDTLRIEIQDNGIGIKEEFHADIFAMFRRLHSRRKYDGTGIGLAVCKKIVEKHGGQIGVESKPGQGATFWFTLSLAKQAEMPTEQLQNMIQG